MVTPNRTLRYFLLFFLATAGVVLGTSWNWDWLVQEHLRLEPWRIPLIWLSIATAAFWYLYFLLGCLTGTGNREGGERKKLWLVVATFFLSMGADVAFSIQCAVEEETGYEDAVRVNARVFAGETKQLRFNKGKMYRLDCDFIDQRGVRQETVFIVGASELPGPVCKAVDDRDLPRSLEIAYDPDWPARTWLTSSKSPNHNRLHFLSLSILLFQGILTWILLSLRQRSTGERYLPAEVCPFLATAVVLFLSGFGKLLIGEA